MKRIKYILSVLTIFSIAMGFLESAVVVYIRALYYPNGFEFPLVPFDNIILVTELFRELATMLMLLSIAIVIGKNFIQRFAMFLYAFGIWDIFYYLFLKLLIDWPASLFTWDILFLLPVPWIGPVLVPCLLSLTMITLALSLIFLQERQYQVELHLVDWILLILGSLVVIGSFTADYLSIIMKSTKSKEVGSLLDNLQDFVPNEYNWFVFIIGWSLILTGIFIINRRSIKSVK